MEPPPAITSVLKTYIHTCKPLMCSSCESAPLLSSTESEESFGPQPPLWVPNPHVSEEVNRPRTLILCFDGTGDQFDKDNSNVVQFLSCLMKGDPEHQLVYYQTGIGTYTDANIITPILSKISKTLDSMLAWNLGSHVQDGYEFLMDNYTAGDRISIFGFSRGAYTARALAGMIQRVGLLPAGNKRHIPLAWSMYAREDEEAEKESADFKRTFSADIIIDFVGVWDTVASVGIVNRELPFVRNNTAIRVFRHALALDEHRAKFLPNFYHAGTQDANAKVPIATAPATNQAVPPVQKSWPPSHYPKKSRDAPTDACEVWFAGCHCDVGGGSVKNGEAHSLARIPLRWMIRECFRMKTGIVFDANALKRDLGLDIDTLYPFVRPRKERISAKEHWKAIINPTPSQESAVVSFLKTVGLLLWFPIRSIYKVASWPLGYAWLFLNYIIFVEDDSIHSHKPKPTRISSRDSSINSCTRSLVARKERKEENGTVCNSPCVTEEEHEFYDALSPEYDQLGIRWYWKIMEYIPFRFAKQTGDRNQYYVRANLSQGRKITNDALFDPTQLFATDSFGCCGGDFGCENDRPPTGLSAGTYRQPGGLKIHRSVLTRMEARYKDGKTYTPRAQYKLFGKSRSWYQPNPHAMDEWEWVE